MRTRLAALALLAAALAAPARATAATEVSYAALLHEVKSGPLIRAVINRAGGDIEIKFRNLSEWKAPYPPGAQPTLQRILRERHIRVIFATPTHLHKARAVHHHLRYIAAALLGALAVAGGVFLYLRRRRARSAPAGEPSPT